MPSFVFSGEKLSQISYKSTLRKLTDKYQYPTLFRTSFSDESQAQALADIVKNFRWRKVLESLNINGSFFPCFVDYSLLIII